MTTSEDRRHELSVAADILDAEIRLVFGEDTGIEDDQRLLLTTADTCRSAWLSCHDMLDDMEARMNVRVDRVRELVRME